MSDNIIIALITGGMSLLGVIFSNKSSENRINQQLEIHQAVTDTKLEELTREVREHNDFARRIPVIESEIQHIKANIQKLEKYHN
jgi:hypothetical protein